HRGERRRRTERRRIDRHLGAGDVADPSRRRALKIQFGSRHGDDRGIHHQRRRSDSDRRGNDPARTRPRPKPTRDPIHSVDRSRRSFESGGLARDIAASLGPSALSPDGHPQRPANQLTPSEALGQLKTQRSRYLMRSYTQPKISTTLPDAKANIIAPVSSFQFQSGTNPSTNSARIRGEAIDQMRAARFQASD